MRDFSTKHIQELAKTNGVFRFNRVYSGVGTVTYTTVSASPVIEKSNISITPAGSTSGSVIRLNLYVPPTVTGENPYQIYVYSDSEDILYVDSIDVGQWYNIVTFNAPSINVEVTGNASSASLDCRLTYAPAHANFDATKFYYLYLRGFN